MLRTNTPALKKLLSTLLLSLISSFGFGQVVIDSLEKSGSKPGYRWRDSFLNRFSYQLPHSPLVFVKPDSLHTYVEYKPGAERIDVEEKLGPAIDVKIPQSMTFNEYSSIQNAMVRQSLIRDYERMQDGSSTTSGR